MSAAYVDPGLLGSDRLYLAVSAGYRYSQQRVEDQFESYPVGGGAPRTISYRTDGRARQITGDLSVGYRLWSYSYLYADYQYAESRSRNVTRDSDGYAQVSTPSFNSELVTVGLGWDSEDDAFFPTRGSRISLSTIKTLGVGCSTCYDFNWAAALKSTWSFGARSSLTVQVGGEPDAPNDQLRPIVDQYPGDVGITYSYSLATFEGMGGFRRSRWYVHAATGPVQLRSHGQIGGGPDRALLTIGVRLESKTLGLVDLSATAVRVWPERWQ